MLGVGRHHLVVGPQAEAGDDYVAALGGRSCRGLAADGDADKRRQPSAKADAQGEDRQKCAGGAATRLEPLRLLGPHRLHGGHSERADGARIEVNEFSQSRKGPTSFGGRHGSSGLRTTTGREVETANVSSHLLRMVFISRRSSTLGNSIAAARPHPTEPSRRIRTAPSPPPHKTPHPP